MKISFFTLIILCSGSAVRGQITDFVDQSTLCLEEELDLSGLESQLQSYTVDYCLGEFDESPIDEQLLLFSGTENFRIQGSDLVYDSVNNSYHMFLVDNSRQTLRRVDFGDSLTRTFETQLVTIASGSLIEPSEIDVVKDTDGNWYAFVASSEAGTGITRIDFGTSLTSNNVPAINLGTFDQANAVIRSVAIRKEGENQYLIGLLQNNDRFLVLEYGTSFLNIPIDTLLTSPVTGINDPIGFDIVELNGEVLAYAVGLSSRNIVRVNFGSTVFSDIVLENTYDDAVFPSINSGLSRINIQESYGEYYASVTHFDNDSTFFIDLKGLDNSIQPEELNYKATQFTDISGGYYNGNYIYYGAARRRMGIIAFESQCNASETIQQDPVVPVSYSSPGQYILGLSGRTTEGGLVSLRDTVEVLNSVAPDIDFTMDDNICVDASNSFTSVNTSGDITAYSWDFDGDGLEDSSDPDPVYSFEAPGEYEVKLTVSNASGCSNEVIKTVTIFPAPQQPTDFVVSSAGSFCSSSVLDFSYEVEPELTGVASFLWDFNGEGSSTDQHASFAFPTPGEKTVGLTVSIPGCTTAVYSEVVEVLAGPDVAFEFSNNCFGAPVQFTNLSSGNGNLTYLWDFGDGTGSSTEENPTYQYENGGNYIISLTVTNESGCITVETGSIFINDQPLASISAGEAVENLPVTIEGIDQTLADDSVVSWQWDFAGLASSVSQDTTLVFSEPGEYLITLIITTASGCTDTITDVLTVEESQRATPAFVLDDPYCRDEKFSITNTSVNAESFYWDLCLGEFSQAPAVERLASFSSNFRLDGMDLTYDSVTNSYFVFVVDNSLSTMKRLNFGDSLGRTFTEEQVTFSEGALISPAEIEIVKAQNGNWYGFVGSSQAGVGVKMINFGASLISDNVTVSDLGTFGQGNIQIRGLTITQQGGTDYLVALNLEESRFVMIEFANSFNAQPTDTIITAEIPGISNARGFDLLEKDGERIAYVVGLSSSNIVRLNFGTDLTTGFETENVYDESLFETELVSLSDIFVIESFGNYYALVTQSGDEETLVLDLGDLDNDRIPSDLGFTLPELSDITGAYFEGNYFFYGVGGRRLEYISFMSQCSSQNLFSTAVSPELSFSEAGNIPVGLQAFHRSGSVSAITDTIEIASDIAPDIDFAIGSSRCVTNPVQFNSINASGDIISFAWDFDGDGIIDNTEENPSFQFSAPGIYQVRLDVSSEGCENSVTGEITIFPEPEVSSFEIEGEQFCTGDEISFNNTSVETGLENIITYQWDFDGEAISTEKNSVFAFSSPGVKEISLQSIIPGCTTTVFTRQLTVNSPPEIDFDFTRVCEGEATEFFDISTATDLVEFSWDFSDGFTSNIEDPFRVFSSQGTYPVTYTAEDSNGCSSSITKEVIVGQIPDPQFTITGDLACSGTDLQFNDVTDNSLFNVRSRRWFVDGVQVSEEETPVLAFDQAGEYSVSLFVENEFLCNATLDSTLVIASSPVADFAVATSCIGSPTDFLDESEGDIRSWFWVINGVEYFEQNPSVIFSEAGVYDVSLEVTSANFCSAVTQSTFEITAIPDPGFEFSADCAFEQIRFIDTSTVFEDEVVSRTWDFGDGAQANGAETFHRYTSPGLYEVSLTLQTENGCSIVYSEEVEVNPSPVAGFEVVRDFGIPPFSIRAEDRSENATRIEWFINDQFLAVDDQAAPTIPVTEEGFFELKQVVINAFGCRDSTVMEIISGIPEYDLILSDFEIVDRNGTSSFVISVRNESNLPLDQFNIDISLNNGFIVREQYEGVIRQGEQIVYTLSTTVPAQNLGYVCVEVSPANETYADVNNIDNEDCRNLAGRVEVSDAYPNPSSDFAELDVVLDQAREFELMITDVSGNILVSEQFSENAEALQKIRIDLRNYRKGLYLVVFDFGNERIVRRIIRN